MTGKVLLLDHPVSHREDGASTLLGAWGCDLDWCCPGRGETLPDPEDYAAAIVYGGVENISETRERSYLHDEMDWIGAFAESGKPFLGICLGAQLLAHALGGEVTKHPELRLEIGYFPVEPTEAGRASGFLTEPLHVYQWHGEGFQVPAGGERLASGKTFANQAFRYGDRAYGFQFHPEVSPDTIRRWMKEVPHMLELPGAQRAEEQFSLAERHQEPMVAWFESFLKGWLPRP